MRVSRLALLVVAMILIAVLPVIASPPENPIPKGDKEKEELDKLREELHKQVEEFSRQLEEHSRQLEKVQAEYEETILKSVGLTADADVAALLSKLRDQVAGTIVARRLTVSAPYNPFGVAFMIEDLGSEDADVRTHAARVLAIFGPRARRAVPALVRASRDAEPKVRLSAAVALHKVDPGNPAGVPALISALRVRPLSGYLRALAPTAQVALAPLITGRVAPDLQRTLRSSLVEVRFVHFDAAQARREAVLTLEKMGLAAEPAIPALRAVVSDDKELRTAATLALKTIQRLQKEQQFWKAAIPELSLRSSAR